ncbi:MAG: hypothetical protein IH840_01840 [Candidatus Heimdallarchaeota archaeon]|nr:hypothetical protein [Candidatus Heimdallarchaeota archaeon]
MSDRTTEFNEGDSIKFQAATVYARSISKAKVFQGSSSHRKQYVKCEIGNIVVDQRWTIGGN